MTAIKEHRGKIIVFANPKGGVGKSTISCLVTAMLSWSGKYDMVQMVDADQQASSLRLLKRIAPDVACSHYPISYEYDKLNMIMLDQIVANFRMRQNNILIIDTPARPNQEGMDLFAKAHAVIVPVSNTLAELPTTADFISKMDKIKARSGKVHPHLLVIPNKIHRNRKNLDQFTEYFKDNDVVIGPAIHDSSLVRKVYHKEYESKALEKEYLFKDMKRVVSFIEKYVIKEELDEIYRIDDKYERGNITYLDR